MSNITATQVKKLAALAKLHVSDEEVEKYTSEFESILGFIAQLNEVDTEGVEPTSQVTGLVNVQREDTITAQQAGKKELLAGAPDTDGDYVRVKKVL